MAKFSDDRVRAILLGSRAPVVYRVPVGDAHIEVAIRVLSDADLDAARIAGQGELREWAKKRGWPDPSIVADIDPGLLARFIERQYLWRACLDPETVGNDEPARFFDSPADLQRLDSTVVTRLGELFLEHQEWANPAIGLSTDEVEELIDALGKSEAPAVFLGAYAPSTVRRFALSLVRRLRSI